MFHLDFETRSEVDLKKCGAYRYAEDPSTKILMCAIAEDDGDPLLWVNPEWDSIRPSDEGAHELLQQAANDFNTIYAHNAMFERAVSKYHWESTFGFSPPEIESWRCTSAMARRAGLPPSLEKLSQALTLGEHAKSDTGIKLIKQFSNPPFDNPFDHEEDWIMFCAYCKQDVRAEQKAHEILKKFDAPHGINHNAYLLDARVNDRGFPVNRGALLHAQKLMAVVKEMAELEYDIHTDGLRPTQVAASLKWLRDHGYPFTNLQAKTMDEALKDPSWATNPKAIKALEIKANNSFAALAKIPAMLKCANKDDKVRGTLYYHGAGTGRWSAKLVQPQNFKRPTTSNTWKAYKLIKTCGRIQEIAAGQQPGEVLASCVRHFIEPHGENECFLDADYANIEARLVAWISGQEDALEQYRQGEDLYIRMASAIFGCTEEHLMERKLAGESTTERFVGKQAILGCGFGMGATKFAETCAKWGVPVTGTLAQKAIDTFRTRNHKIVKFWGNCEKAMYNAVRQPNRVQFAGALKFIMQMISDIPYLVMQLPSGRCISYPWPSRFDGLSYWGSGRFTVEQSERTTGWGRVHLYGGKIVENAVQGMAADIMVEGACNAEARGFEICNLIHDQALALHDINEPNHKERERMFGDAMSTLPGWANGLPIDVDLKVTNFYTK